MQLCDAITIERDIQREYISSLTTQLDRSIFEKKELSTENEKLSVDRDKFKKKSKKRGKVIAAIIAVEVLRIAFKLL